jgi:MipA family protein
MIISSRLGAAALACLSLAAPSAVLAEGDRPFSFSGTLGAVAAPGYEGSDETVTGALVDFNVSFADGRYFAGTRGIGFAPVLTDELTVTVAVGYGGARAEDDHPSVLLGMGEIKGEALGIVAATYTMGMVSLEAEVAGGADYGTTAKLALSAGTKCTERFTIGGELAATYADGQHMQRYFGVTSAQSASSGNAAYAAGSGLKSVGIGLNASYALTEATSVAFGARRDRLMGDAADSPITLDADQTIAFLGLSTRF